MSAYVCVSRHPQPDLWRVYDEAGTVAILSNDFEAQSVVNSAAQECASDTVKVTANATAEHKNIQGPALTANPAEYTVAVVANNSIVPLLNDGLIRPLDDRVAKYGQDLQPNQLIKIDGTVMAIAFLGNGQHLFFRKDTIGRGPVVGRRPDRGQDLGRRRRSQLPGHGPRHQPRGDRRQSHRRHLAGQGLYPR